MKDLVTISVRLSPDDHRRLNEKCETQQPPTNPTAIARWLLLKWLHEQKEGKSR